VRQKILLQLKYVLLFYLFLKLPQYSFSQDYAWDTKETREIGAALKHGIFAAGESLLSNGVVMLFNKYVTRTNWAFPTSESIKGNFTTPWEWEEVDGFFVNQLGHPYQGSYYFNAGRVNGFGFYESVFFSAFGSAIWETLGESKHAGMNDFVTTVFGSMVMGEVLYRLYIEARSGGVPAPVAFFINPMAGFHSLITGWKPPEIESNIYQFEAYTGTVYSDINFSASGLQQDVFSFRGFSGNIGMNIIYGNPFKQETWIPFRHFEFMAGFGLNPGKYKDIRVNIDGYIFSFSPVYTNKNMLSTGLSMHLDFVSQGKSGIVDSTIDQYSNAIDWTVKYEHLFSENTVLQIKNHAGFTFLGVSNYYNPSGVNHPYSPERTIYDIKTYGFGFNTKCFLIFQIMNFGRLETNLFSYFMWTYPGLVSLSKGYVSWHFFDITYSQFITEKIFLRVMGSFAWEKGTFQGYPDTDKSSRAVKLFVGYSF
jgi:hypothetical protein